MHPPKSDRAISAGRARPDSSRPGSIHYPMGGGCGWLLLVVVSVLVVVVVVVVVVVSVVVTPPAPAA